MTRTGVDAGVLIGRVPVGVTASADVDHVLRAGTTAGQRRNWTARRDGRRTIAEIACAKDNPAIGVATLVGTPVVAKLLGFLFALFFIAYRQGRTGEDDGDPPPVRHHSQGRRDLRKRRLVRRRPR